MPNTMYLFQWMESYKCDGADWHDPATPFSSLHRSSLWKPAGHLQSQRQWARVSTLLPESEPEPSSAFDTNVFCCKASKAVPLLVDLSEEKTQRFNVYCWKTPHGNTTLLSTRPSRKRKKLQVCFFTPADKVDLYWQMLHFRGDSVRNPRLRFSRVKFCAANLQQIWANKKVYSQLFSSLCAFR